nr:hypothetical protein CFP56_58359 [Quercus suber]
MGAPLAFTGSRQVQDDYYVEIKHNTSVISKSGCQGKKIPTFSCWVGVFESIAKTQVPIFIKYYWFLNKIDLHAQLVGLDV